MQSETEIKSNSICDNKVKKKTMKLNALQAKIKAYEYIIIEIKTKFTSLFNVDWSNYQGK